MESPPYFLGCPVWAHAGWVGNFFTSEATRADYLPQYASVFRTVEGNSTFYGLPSRETVARWTAEAPAGFRFCFKFPRAVSHDRQLIAAEDEAGAFLDLLAPLGERLGPLFLQLPVGFGPSRLGRLDAFLAGLPARHAYAVEVRHPAFFESPAAAEELDALLAARGADRVLFDTRVLFTSTATDAATLEAQRKKPRLPACFSAPGRRPFVRFVGDPGLPANGPALARWAEQVSRWIDEGRTPFFFTHHPNDRHAPALARAFHEALRARRPGLAPLPSWPADRPARGPGGQLELF